MHPEPPPPSGLNHLTLAVSDLDRAFDFYVRVLRCRPRARWARGAYLSAGSLWLCLSLDARAEPRADCTHVALGADPSTMDPWRERLAAAGVPLWKENASEGDSIYFLDPDGHRLELHAGDLESRLEAVREAPYEAMELFDPAPSAPRRAVAP